MLRVLVLPTKGFTRYTSTLRSASHHTFRRFGTTHNTQTTAVQVADSPTNFVFFRAREMPAHVIFIRIATTVSSYREYTLLFLRLEPVNPLQSSNVFMFQSSEALALLLRRSFCLRSLRVHGNTCTLWMGKNRTWLPKPSALSSIKSPDKHTLTLQVQPPSAHLSRRGSKKHALFSVTTTLRLRSRPGRL